MSLNDGLSATAQNNATIVTTAGITTQASGSGIVIGWAYTDGSTPAAVPIYDNKGNEFFQVGAEELIFTNLSRNRLYRCNNAIGGTGHTFSGECTGANPQSIYVVEITTGGGGIALNQNADSVVGLPAPHVSSPILPTVPDVMLVGFTSDDSTAGTWTHTEGTGFTVQEEQTDASNTWTGAVATKPVSSIASYNTSWTVTGGAPVLCAEFIAAFSEVSAVPTRNLASMRMPSALVF